jgi:glycerate 2-kinase
MPLASDAGAIARAGVRSVQPATGLRRILSVRGGNVRVGGAPWAAADHGTVRLVALGKAAGPLIDAASRILGEYRGDAVAAIGRGYPRPKAPARILVGEHPVPGAGSLSAGRGLVEFVDRTSDTRPILFLLSGGGSAIAELPSGGISLPELQQTTRALLGSGAPIGATNTLRRHLSELKGGGLAKAAGTRRIATLALSDVVGDAPWEIASGPTVPDPTTYRDALAVVRRYHLSGQLPKRVLRHLQDGAAGHHPETWKPPPESPSLHGFHLLGSNRIAQAAAAGAARRRGYTVTVEPRNVVGEAAREGRRLALALRHHAEEAQRKFALISGGETTVTLPRSHGVGGRSEEMALAAVPVLDAAGDLHFLAVATDGVDGPTDSAGGRVDGRTAARARSLGVDVADALRTHSADGALQRLGARYVTGPTGTNVADLQIRLGRPRTGSTRRPGGARSSRRRRS